MRLAFTCVLTLAVSTWPVAATAQGTMTARACRASDAGAPASGSAARGNTPSRGQAEGELRAAVLARPQSAAPYIDLGRCYYEEQKLADAAATLSRALEVLHQEQRLSAPESLRPHPVRTGGTAPQYPEAARLAGRTGIVFVEVHIDAVGHVREARVVGSVPDFDALALDAVGGWTFAPTISNGRAVETTTVLRLKFSPTPDLLATDFMDIARFEYGQRQYQESEAALTRAVAMVGEEQAFAREVAAAARSDQQGVVMPACRIATPPYPARAKPRGVSGDSIVEVLVRVDGSVVPVRIVRPLDPDLDAIAMEAVRSSRCLGPATRNGMEVPVVVTLSFTWRAPE